MIITPSLDHKEKTVHGWRDHKEFDNHEFLMALTDEASGLQAFIAIHNTNLGPALGGTRMIAYDSEEFALEDALNLSKAMSYKCALAKLPYGGGKGVIMANPTKDRNETLKAYARLVEKLGGLLKTGTDVGTSDEDVALMAQETSHMLGVTPADRGDLNTSKAAALGVFHAMKAALQHLHGSNDFQDKKVAIKGVGKLGGELARLISEAGGTVYVSDIDPAKCESAQKRSHNIEIVANEDIHKQQVDVYSPCALGNEFTTQIVEELQCQAIVGGANNQLSDDTVGDMIYKRGILYTPDYIANAGGLIYVADELEKDGFNKERVLHRIDDIEHTVGAIFEQSARENLSPSHVADLIALARMKEARHG